MSIPACQSPGGLFDTYFAPPDALPEPLRTGDFLFRNGMTAYREGDFQRAASFFAQSDPESLGFDTLSYFIGVSELAGGAAERSIGFLEAAEAVSDADLHPHILWYLALARIKASQPGPARQTLEQLAGMTGHPYQEQVTSLLNALEK